MVNRAAVRADSLLDADLGIAAESLTSWREECLRWQRRDLDRALSSFTFIADVTSLSEDCCFVGDSQRLVARYDGLPFAAIAFCSRDRASPEETPRRIAELTRRLVSPQETFACLVAERDRPLIEAAYRVLKIYPEWQMVFRGDALNLDPGRAVALGPSDVSKMRALARYEGLMAFGRDPLGRGPWYGIWHPSRSSLGSQLVAQGGTRLVLDQAAEIGNIVTARAFRRRGYGSQVVAALLRDLTLEGYSVFLQVLKENTEAIAFYEHLGFEKHHDMIIAQCSL